MTEGIFIAVLAGLVLWSWGLRHRKRAVRRHIRAWVLYAGRIALALQDQVRPFRELYEKEGSDRAGLAARISEKHGKGEPFVIYFTADVQDMGPFVLSHAQLFSAADVQTFLDLAFALRNVRARLLKFDSWHSAIVVDPAKVSVPFIRAVADQYADLFRELEELEGIVSLLRRKTQDYE